MTNGFHMHPAAYVHGPVLITYLRDILAVGCWIGDLFPPAHPSRLWVKGGTTAVTRQARVRGARSEKSTSGRGGLPEGPRPQYES